MSKSKYLLIYTGPIVGYFSLTLKGFWPWLLPLYAYFLVPLLEFVLPQPEVNFNKEEEKDALNDKFYDYVLYSLVPLQYVLMGVFLYYVSTQDLVWHEMLGRVLTAGIACVVLGINVGHELGHRTKPHERIMAKLLLLSSQYMHFIIEHNRGHHKNVATPLDPATSRKGEWLYAYWVRSITGSYISAWRLEAKRLKSKKINFWSWKNEMIQFLIIQLSLLALIHIVFDWKGLAFYAGGAGLGIIFFETVNYLEHYGLTRQKNENGVYERVRPIHSWNSNHILGRALLFQVTRHSDHHFLASRKYQILRHFDEAPQLPAGYPVMILLAAIPPLWFKVMHPHMEKIKQERLEMNQPITSIA